MKKHKNILAIDTAMSACSAAVMSEYEFARSGEFMPRGQSEALMPMVCSAVTEAGLEFSELEAVVTTLGPGAFTGLRIGLSTAKALGLSLGIPVYGVSTLQSLAHAYTGGGRVRVLVETRRDDFYVQDFEDGVALNEAQALPCGDIAAMDGVPDALIGDAAMRFVEEAGGEYTSMFVEGYDAPDMRVMIDGLKAGTQGYVDVIEPIYLRGADVSVSKKVYRKLS